MKNKTINNVTASIFILTVIFIISGILLLLSVLNIISIITAIAATLTIILFILGLLVTYSIIRFLFYLYDVINLLVFKKGIKSLFTNHGVLYDKKSRPYFTDSNAYKKVSNIANSIDGCYMSYNTEFIKGTPMYFITLTFKDKKIF